MSNSDIETWWRSNGRSACALFKFYLIELQAEANRLGLKKSGRKGELILDNGENLTQLADICHSRNYRTTRSVLSIRDDQ